MRRQLDEDIKIPVEVITDGQTSCPLSASLAFVIAARAHLIEIKRVNDDPGTL
jgi:hypothetical protein